jgi:hyaluronoglucosaminidase
MMFNPMIQAEASKIPLVTIGEYLSDPERYDPQVAWEMALREVAGERGYAPIRTFAENCLASCLQPDEAPETDRLAAAALASVRRGERAEDSEAVSALSHYLDQLDEAIYQIRNRVSNVSLRQNILPWVDSLDEKLWLGRRALTLFRAYQAGDAVPRMVTWLQESLEEVHANPRSIGGRGVIELAEYVYETLKDQGQREPAQDCEPSDTGDAVAGE